jgi:hypothetical protein
MSKTLKNNYQQRKITELRIKIREIDESQENLNEAFNEQLTKQASDLIKKLNTIQWPEPLQVFKTTTKHAVDELNKIFAGSGRDEKLSTKISNLFGEKENPFVDVIAYASAINNFFSHIEQYVKNNNKENKGFVSEVIGNDPKAWKQLVKQGLKPEGSFSSFKTNWTKYLKDGASMKDVDQVLQLSVDELSKLSENIKTQLSGVGTIARAVTSSVVTDTTKPAGAEPTVKPQGGQSKILNALRTARLSTKDKTVKRTIQALVKAGIISKS